MGGVRGRPGVAPTCAGVRCAGGCAAGRSAVGRPGRCRLGGRGRPQFQADARPRADLQRTGRPAGAAGAPRDVWVVEAGTGAGAGRPGIRGCGWESKGHGRCRGAWRGSRGVAGVQGAWLGPGGVWESRGVPGGQGEVQESQGGSGWGQGGVACFGGVARAEGVWLASGRGGGRSRGMAGAREAWSGSRRCGGVTRQVRVVGRDWRSRGCGRRSRGQAGPRGRGRGEGRVQGQ